jgi:hypothetical protein
MFMMMTFQKFAGLLAILAGVCGLLYSLSFIVLSQSAPEQALALSGLLLMLGGLLTTAGMIALYQRLEEFDSGFALWALVLGLASALGATVHGAYDLANAINPPDSNMPSFADLPNQVDPRGLFTFGIAGLAILVFSWLIIRSGVLPKNFGNLGLLLGLLLIVIYLGRLVILDTTNAVNVVPALLVGFIINPIWYIWLGIQLRR